MSASEDIELNNQIVSQVKDASPNEENTEIEPTEEELETLQHVSEGIPMRALLVVFCELCERFAFYGLAAPFQNYIQHPLSAPGDKQPGALGRGQRVATSLMTFFQFLAYLTPVFGAVIADQYWGKYKTIIVSCIVYMVGLSVLVVTSIIPLIKLGVAFYGLIVAIIIISFGTGGMKSNVSPLMAEQYTRTKPIVKVIGNKKKIIDPKITIQSMFNWFYWAINLGSLSSLITTNVEKYHSFWLAYLIPMIVFTIDITVLILGRHLYIRKPPTGSLIVRAFRVTSTAIRTRMTQGKRKDVEHILDYAKEPSSSSLDHDDHRKVGELTHNQFIDDLKQAMNACRVFAFYPFYWICYNQMMSNLVSQAAQMNVGPLPNDVLQNIDPIVLIIFIPIFDKLIYPAFRRCNINLSSIMRITCGFFFASLTMGWAALVQHLIYQTGPNYNYTQPCEGCQSFNNITVAWQVPSYFFLAISEIFASITGLEYAFTQAPSSMKSIVMSLFLFTSAIGSALNFALIPVTVNPKLLWMYTALAIVAFAVGILFLLVFRNDEKRKKKQTVKQ